MSSGGQGPQVWEVWHARFDFSEGRGYKYRPVIVVGLREDGSLVMMVTSAANKLSLPHCGRTRVSFDLRAVLA